MGLPAEQDTSADYKYFVNQSETQDHPTTVATEVVTKGDLGIINPTSTRPFVGIAENSAAIGESVKWNIREGIALATDQIETGQAFNTKHADVWFDNVNKVITPNEADGLFLVGKVQQVESSGVVTFLKRRFAIIGEGT